MGSKGVPQDVRRDTFESGDAQHMSIHDTCHTATVDPFPAGIEKQRPTAGQLSAPGQTNLDRIDGAAAHRHDAFLAPLAHHPHHASGQVQIANVEACQLGNPQPAGVEHFQDCPVTQGMLVVGLGRLHQGGDLIDVQMERQAVLFFRCSNQLGRVLGDDPAPQQEFEKGADGGQFPADGTFLGIFTQLSQVAPQQQVVHITGGSICALLADDEGRQLFQITTIGCQGVGRYIALRVQISAEGTDLIRERFHHDYSKAGSPLFSFQLFLSLISR